MPPKSAPTSIEWDEEIDGGGSKRVLDSEFVGFDGGTYTIGLCINDKARDSVFLYLKDNVMDRHAFTALTAEQAVSVHERLSLVLHTMGIDPGQQPVAVDAAEHLPELDAIDRDLEAYDG